MKHKPRIALIADEFTQIALAPEADIIHLTPNNWRLQLLGRKAPDMLFVESAWRGYKNSWQGKLAAPLGVDTANSDSNTNSALNSIVKWFR